MSHTCDIAVAFQYDVPESDLLFRDFSGKSLHSLGGGVALGNMIISHPGAVEYTIMNTGKWDSSFYWNSATAISFHLQHIITVTLQ